MQQWHLLQCGWTRQRYVRWQKPVTKVTYRMIPFVQNVQNRQDRDSRLIRSCPGSQWGMGWGYMTGDRVSFGGDENAQNLIVTTAAQPCEYTEHLLNIYSSIYTIESYILKGWLVRYVNSISKKLLKKSITYQLKNLICKASWDDPPRHRGPWLTRARWWGLSPRLWHPSGLQALSPRVKVKAGTGCGRDASEF